MEKAFKKRFVILVLPTLIAFTVAFIIPFILGIYLSFTKFTTVADAQWVGLSNYIVAFQDKDFLASLWFTVKFVLVNLVTINLIAFALAYVLSRKLRGTNIFRTVIFMPNLPGRNRTWLYLAADHQWCSCFFQNNAYCEGLIRILGNGDRHELADDRIYDGYLHCGYPEYFRGCKGSGSYRWSKPETDGYKDHPASDHACNYDLSVYDNDKCI